MFSVAPVAESSPTRSRALVRRSRFQAARARPRRQSTKAQSTATYTAGSKFLACRSAWEAPRAMFRILDSSAPSRARSRKGLSWFSPTGRRVCRHRLLRPRQMRVSGIFWQVLRFGTEIADALDKAHRPLGKGQSWAVSTTGPNRAGFTSVSRKRRASRFDRASATLDQISRSTRLGGLLPSGLREVP